MFIIFPKLIRPWWGEPHLAIGYLAESMITEKQLQYINDVLGTWNSEKAVFHDVANWHDDLKPIGMPLMVPWHFRNQPIFETGFKTDSYPINFNVTTVNQQCIDTILNKTTTNLWALNFCFRSLAHFVGDAHCPVHAAGYWSEKYPQGDQGGTSQKNVCDSHVYGSDVCKNLHMMWDSACLDYQTYPIPDNQFEEFHKNYTSLWTEYPPSDNYGAEADSVDPQIWESNAYSVAKNYVYGNLPSDAKITPEYISKGAPEAKKLISVGGRRLGLVLRKFFEERESNLPQIDTSKSIASEVIAWVIDCVLFIIAVVYIVLVIRSSSALYGFSPLIEH